MSTEEVPERLGIRAMARMVGIDHTTLRDAEKDGYVSRGKDRKFIVAEVLAWRESVDPQRQEWGKKRNEPTPEEEGTDNEAGLPSQAASKRRLEALKVEQLEIKVAEMRGDLVDRQEVEGSVEAIMVSVQLRMKNLVPKLRPFMSDDGREILDREVQAALEGMANDLDAIANANTSDELDD